MFVRCQRTVSVGGVRTVYTRIGSRKTAIFFFFTSRPIADSACKDSAINSVFLEQILLRNVFSKRKCALKKREFVIILEENETYVGNARKYKLYTLYVYLRRLIFISDISRKMIVKRRNCKFEFGKIFFKIPPQTFELLIAFFNYYCFIREQFFESSSI